MEFKIILSDREISLDLALYTTLALFVIVPKDFRVFRSWFNMDRLELSEEILEVVSKVQFDDYCIVE